MLAELTAGANLPFSIALLLLLALALLEGVGLLLGAGLSHALGHWLPDSVVDHDPAGLGDHGMLGQLLGWLHIGKVPLLVLLVVFLTAFGLGGLLLQAAAVGLSGRHLPTLAASLLMLAPSLYAVRCSGAALGRVMPADETEAVSSQSFIGRVAVITLGQAGFNSPAQARLHDRYGQSHYVMVAPDAEGERFETGSEVLLVKQEGGLFRAICNPHAALDN